MGQHQASNIHLVELSEVKKWALKKGRNEGPKLLLFDEKLLLQKSTKLNKLQERQT